MGEIPIPFSPRFLLPSPGHPAGRGSASGGMDMITAGETCNGWSNEDTWAVAVEIDNDERVAIQAEKVAARCTRRSMSAAQAASAFRTWFGHLAEPGHKRTVNWR